MKNIKVMLAALDRGELSEIWLRDTLAQRLMIMRQKRRELEQLERSIEETLSQPLEAALRTSDIKDLARWMQSASPEKIE